MRLEHISIVLVRPRGPGNIGSVVRAMKNTGLKNLVLIDPCDFKNDETRKMAVGDTKILNKAKIFPTLKEALKPYHFTVATTRRTRRRFNQFVAAREMAQKIVRLPKTSKIAVVFGTEDKGLKNAEISLCQAVSMIPSHPKFPSLNLAQAVMVYAYEIFLAAWKSMPEENTDLASNEEMEGMYGHLQTVLEQIEFFTRGKPQTLMESIRNFSSRTSLSPRDVRILRGIFSSIQRKIKLAGGGSGK
jgi:tRNA/rRNA methyltransferase